MKLVRFDVWLLLARRLLQRTDWFTQEKACKLLTAILLARPNKEIHLANGAGPSSSTGTAAWFYLCFAS